MDTKKSLKLAECLTPECISIEDWYSKATTELNFSKPDVELAKKIVTSPADSSDHSIYGTALEKLKSQKKLGKADIVCHFSGESYLAWGCPEKDEIKFYVVDLSLDHSTLLELNYGVHDYIEGFIQAYRGSCRPPLRNYIDFGYWSMPATSQVLVMGPPEVHPFACLGEVRNGCRLINYDKLTTEEFSIQLPSPHDKDGSALPVALSADPRPGHEQEVTMICHTACANLEHGGPNDVLGYPTRYSFEDRKVKAIFTEKVMFGKVLQYLKGGQQVATLEHEDYDEGYQNKLPQKIWIFDTDSLVPLYHVLHTCLDDITVLLHSADEQYISVISAGYELGNYKRRANVSKCPSYTQQQQSSTTSAPVSTLSTTGVCKMFKVELCRQY